MSKTWNTHDELLGWIDFDSLSLQDSSEKPVFETRVMSDVHPLRDETATKIASITTWVPYSSLPGNIGGKTSSEEDLSCLLDFSGVAHISPDTIATTLNTEEARVRELAKKKEPSEYDKMSLALQEAIKEQAAIEASSSSDISKKDIVPEVTPEVIPESLESRLGKNIPAEIWEILKPVAAERIQKNDVYFFRIVSFFLDTPTGHEEFAKVDTAQWLGELLDLQTKNLPFSYDKSQERLVRYGNILKYLIYELKIHKERLVIFLDEEKQHIRLRKYIEIIDQHYIQLEVPGIDHNQFSHISVAENRQNFKKTGYATINEKFLEVLYRLTAYINRESQILCKSMWPVIEGIKQEEERKEMEKIWEDEEAEILKMKQGPTIIEGWKDEEETRIHKEAERNREEIALLRKQEKQERMELYAKIEQIWEEVEGEWELTPQEEIERRRRFYQRRRKEREPDDQGSQENQ